ncbi:signal peptide peptidase SppA, partial [candidate division KSB1 bacterium]
MKKRISDLTIGLIVIIVSVFLIFIMAVSLQKKPGDSIKIPSGGSYVGIIELNGTILSSRKIVNLFERYGESSSVKAVVFRINSPGGAIAPSQEIYNAVKRIRDSGKPVVVSMSTVAASGGYYAACGADTIIANPGTTTGSIGVIAEIPNVSGLLKKIGVSFTVVKSG